MNNSNKSRTTTLRDFLTSNPEYATELGDHRFDDKLTDYSAETRAQELARAQQTRQQLEAFNDLSQLTGANKVDVRLLKDNVDNEIFDIEELREWEWNPLVYNQSLANSIYLLVARDFAPAEQRIPNVRKRLEGIPAVIAQAKANLKHSPKIYTETAIEQTQGAISLVRKVFRPCLIRRRRLRRISDQSRKKRPRHWKITKHGCKKICSRVLTVIFASELISSARNCASLSLPIYRWKRSCSAPRRIWRKRKRRSTKPRFHFTKNISRMRAKPR
jgi:hypothetical protein